MDEYTVQVPDTEVSHHRTKGEAIERALEVTSTDPELVACILQGTEHVGDVFTGIYVEIDSHLGFNQLHDGSVEPFTDQDPAQNFRERGKLQ